MQTHGGMMTGAVTRAINQAIAAIAAKKAAFVSAFGDIASKAMDEFDKRVAKWVNPFTKKLDQMQREDAIKSEQDAVDKAQADVAAAQAKVNADAVSVSTPGPNGNVSVMMAPPEDVQALKDAGLALAAALRSQTEGDLGRKAADLDVQHQKDVEAERSKLSAQLNKILEDLIKHHATTAGWMKETAEAARELAAAVRAAVSVTNTPGAASAPAKGSTASRSASAGPTINLHVGTMIGGNPEQVARDLRPHLHREFLRYGGNNGTTGI
jgi:hypothetical protein